MQALHVDLHLEPDLDAQTLDGRCTLTVRAVAAKVTEIVLDAVDFRVDSVIDGAGRSLQFERRPAHLHVQLSKPLAAGDETELTVAYRVERPRAGLFFVAPTADEPDKPRQCWTQSQDEFARFWFPCFDGPDVRQTTSATIVVPRGLFALGNGRLVERRDDGDRTIFRYAQEQPHATYLVTFVAGSFVERAQAGARVPVFYYVAPGREAAGERAFGKTAAMIASFERLIGTPYPWARYSQIAVADFIFGGMENTSATTQMDRVLLDERAALDFDAEWLVSHELAHQWFGDLLTTRDWAHAWLNEGFASYFEAVWAGEAHGYDEHLRAIGQMRDQYLEEAREKYRRPIVFNEYRNPVEIFDRHLYEKGALVLHAIRGELGDDGFWRSIGRYVRENAGRSVETIDLVRAIEAETGRNLRGPVDQWVFRDGHPELRVSSEERAGTTILRVEQTQVIDDAHPPFALELEIGLVSTAPAAPAADYGRAPLPGERRIRLAITRADETFVIGSPDAIGLLRIDPAARVVGSVEFALDTTRATAILRSDPCPTARTRAADRLAREAAPAGRDALAAALAGDPFWAVRASVAKSLGATRAPWATELLLSATAQSHPKVRRAVAAALGSLRGDSVRDALRTLAGDPSYFVCAAALEARGAMRDGRAVDDLQAALERTSWNDTIAGGAVRGLAEIGDAQCVTAILDAANRRSRPFLRQAATRVLGRLYQRAESGRTAIVDAIRDGLADESFFVQDAALGSAFVAADARLVDDLERVAAAAVDGRIRRGGVIAA